MADRRKKQKKKANHTSCADTGCSLEDLPRVIDDRVGWRERESGNSVFSVGHDDDDYNG